MTNSEEVVELVNELCLDRSIPKNVRSVLEEIKKLLADTSKEMGVKIDTSMQMIESISQDPNLSSFIRTQIWELSSVLESLIDENNL